MGVEIIEDIRINNPILVQWVMGKRGCLNKDNEALCYSNAKRPEA